MLLYPNGYCGFPLLFIVNGSVVPRAIVPALLSFGFTHLLQAVVPNFHEYFVSLMVNQYAFGVFSAHVAFLLVFRVNTSYHRYWEGCSHVMTFTTKWGDAVTEAFVHSLDFDRFSESEEKKDSALFRAQLAHLASLMHAVAVAFLRGQTDVGCFETAPEPAKGTNHLKANSAAEAPTYCSVGTWLNAMLRFDSTAKGYQQFLTKYPLNVLGGVSKAEVEELKSLEAVERVHLLHVKILAILTARKANQGFVHVFPPEFARMGAYLSEGNVNFRQAAKLRNCPIPFPYQQLTTICLLLFALLFPIVAVASASGDVTESNLWFAPISTLLSTFLFFAMNEVAREMEDPFMVSLCISHFMPMLTAWAVHLTTQMLFLCLCRQHPPNGYPLVLQQNLFNNRMRVNVASLTEKTLGLTNSANGTLGAPWDAYACATGVHRLLSDYMLTEWLDVARNHA